jgi:hypothetical protein
MATDLHPGRPAPAPEKYEAFVEGQLTRARARIRALDLAAAALGLLILTLAYGLIMALCDRRLEFSPLARQIAFALYAAGALLYVGLLVLRPLFRPINPYYAARRLEATIPEAKNSVVNWVDLHQQAIAPAFRKAISHQAARDLADADLEQAISARRTGWLGTGAALLSVCMLVLFLLGPRQFLSLMNRAFAPFIEAPIATRTRLLVEQPEGGDVTIPVGKAVAFSVWMEGRVPEPSSPEALKLLYRYSLSDPYQERLLERGESSRQWLTNLLASEVHNGFWYKVAGGDAETPEYRVQVRSTPLLTGFDVTYHYHPYLGWPDRTTHEQNLQDLRGTEVTLLARTNRTVKDGQLGIEGQEPIRAELVPDDPLAMRFHLRLESDGNYRIWFRSVEGERNNDPMPYTIRVLQDHPPQVELTKPGEDIQLPANGVLRLQGTASDDFGIARLDLRMKIENGPALLAKPYRKAETLRRGDGSYPQMLAYQDFVELDKLQRENGQPLPALQPGTKIEYWLEGTDNCDYPGPNIGQSKHFKVTIQPPDTDQKKEQQERQEARQEQQKHEKKQDQDLQNQKRETSGNQQDQQARPPEKDQPNKENAQQSDEELNKQKEKIKDAIKKNEQQQKDGDKGEKSDQSQESKANGKGEGAQSQPSKGERASEHPGSQEGSKKEGAQGKGPPGQAKSSGKPQENHEQNSQKGEGQTAPDSNGQQGQNQRGQKSAEPPADQGATQGNQERKEPSAGQNNGSNQTGKSPEDRQKTPERGQAQDRANPQPENGEKKQSKAAPDKGGNNSQNPKEQNSTGGQEKGSQQTAGKKDQGDRASKPNQGKSGTGENAKRSDGQDSSQRSGGHTGERNKETQSDQKRKPQSTEQKADKTRAGQQGAKEQASQPRDEAKQGANAETGQKPNGNEQGGKREPSQKRDETGAGQQKKQGQGGDAKSRAEKASSSQSGSKADQQTNPQAQGKANGDQGASTESNPSDKEKSNTSGTENGSKAQAKPNGTEKRNAGAEEVAKPQNKENGHNSASQGKQAADNSQEKAKVNSGAGADEKDRTQQSGPKRPSAGQSGDKTKNDISALSEALKAHDEKGRAEARKRLEELRDKAKDPQVRQAAREALDRAGQQGADRPAQTQEGTKPGGKGRPDQQAAPKNGQQEHGQGKAQADDQEKSAQQQSETGTGQSDAAKGRNQDANRTEPTRDSRSEAGERGNQTGSPKRPGGSGAAGPKGGSDPSPQKPDGNSSADNPPSHEKDSSEPPMSPNAAYRKQAGELQLEDLKKKINKNVLKQLNMTEEDFQRFVKAYEDMLKRKQLAGAERDNLVVPQRGNRSLPNQKVRQVGPREQGKAGNLQRLDPSVAPPEFREAYKEFSRRISDLEKKK